MGCVLWARGHLPVSHGTQLWRVRVWEADSHGLGPFSFPALVSRGLKLAASQLGAVVSGF